VSHIKTIAFASDHAGYQLKTHLMNFLSGGTYELLDLGTDDSTTSVDYPDYGFKMANAVADGAADCGILICGTGIGISMAANKHPDIRAALCHDITTARLCREHNDANVLVMGERIIGTVTAEDCVTAFLNTEFAGDRHARRVGKLSQLNA